jgi:hypothetical protein
MKGMLDSWSAVTHFAQHSSTGSVLFETEEVQKIPLPANLVTPLLAPTLFRFASSVPVLLTGMSSLVIQELIRIILLALQQNFSLAVSPEVRLLRANNVSADVKVTKHIVCIGSSIMQQIIPYLNAAGYTVTDLSQLGWLATDENIQSLIGKMSELRISQDFCVVCDLFSNCSHRYRQFDGTQSLPAKENGKYHMPGPVECCNEDVFRKIVRSLSPVLLSCQNTVKVVLSPLPRYLFTPCCNAPSHCSNITTDGYSEKALNGVTKLRGFPAWGSVMCGFWTVSVR